MNKLNKGFTLVGLLMTVAGVLLTATARAEILYLQKSADEFAKLNFAAYTPQGTVGTSYLGGNIQAHIMDGNLSTFWEPNGSDWETENMYAGLDLGEEKSITMIAFAQHNDSNDDNSLDGAHIQVANSADFSDAVDVCVLPHQERPDGLWTLVDLDASVRARYVRVYAPPAACWPRVAELLIFGTSFSAVFDTFASMPLLTVLPSLTKENGAAVYRAMSAEGPFERIGTIDKGDLSYYDAAIEPNTTYHYSVAKIGADGVESAREDALAVTTSASVCTREVNLVYSAIEDYFAARPLIHSGTIICGGYHIAGRLPEHAFDGTSNSHWEPQTENWDDDQMYVGLDFGEERWIDSFAITVGSIQADQLDISLNAGYFEIANEADFSDGEIVYVIPTLSMWSGGMYDFRLATPVKARYARFRMPNTGHWPYVGELRFCGLMEMADIAGGRPVLRLAESVVEKGARIFRAESAEGPYTAVADLEAGVREWTDMKIPFGTRGYYKVAKLNRRGEVVQMYDEVVSSLCISRLERLPGGGNGLKDGCSLFFDCEYVPEDNLGEEVDHRQMAGSAFDGDTATFPDIYGRSIDGSGTTYWYSYNPAIGVDFGEGNEQCVKTCRLFTYSVASSQKLGDVAVFGSNASDPKDVVRLGERISDPIPAGLETSTWYEIPCRSRKAYRYVYLRHIDDALTYSWGGIVNEIEFYGWAAGEAVRLGLFVIIK